MFLIRTDMENDNKPNFIFAFSILNIEYDILIQWLILKL